jgi:hypothetical protein
LVVPELREADPQRIDPLVSGSLNPRLSGAHADRFAFASVDRVEQRVLNQVGDAGLMLLVG